ncbi:protoglobin domain-containing protein [Curvivirga aplysinae]|uniref:protoglobin domain-containing protein n=1 Tax=Curvivirga aplysinae TaxID=2529852 RepID=UPI0012BD6ECD|nr:protoglobin domain-containing protein [Curvivirga aplysinae]MTI08538.1 hypothetical protein [Curvivirga aplysinae]
MPKVSVSSQDLKQISSLLPSIEKALPQILADFYRWINATPEIKNILDISTSKSEDLIKEQTNHWMQLLKNGPDDNFQEREKNIGRIHHQM